MKTRSTLYLFPIHYIRKKQVQRKISHPKKREALQKHVSSLQSQMSVTFIHDEDLRTDDLQSLAEEPWETIHTPCHVPINFKCLFFQELQTLLEAQKIENQAPIITQTKEVCKMSTPIFLVSLFDTEILFRLKIEK